MLTLKVYLLPYITPDFQFISDTLLIFAAFQNLLRTERQKDTTWYGIDDDLAVGLADTTIKDPPSGAS